MNDLISRQAAIELILSGKVCEDYRYENPDECNSFLDWAIDMVARMPSAQPASRWIPCEERLPEIDMTYPHHDDYLVQYDSGGMDVASWSNVNRFWTNHVTEPYWNCAQFQTVVAWMLLPELYREETEDGT